MSDSVFRNHGLHKGLSSESVRRLARRFKQDIPASRERRGVFLGIDFLEDVANSIREGGFDGLIVKFGIHPKVGDTPRTYELVATEIELEGEGSFKVIRRGANYASLPGDAVNPPVVGCPPIDSAFE
ncbi:hypothetical protein [Spirosoma areae]